MGEPTYTPPKRQDGATNPLYIQSHPEQPPPPEVPDLTDEVVKKARSAALRRATGMARDFLTGPLGDLTKPPTTGGGI